jgi:hypothetical protein
VHADQIESSHAAGSATQTRSADSANAKPLSRFEKRAAWLASPPPPRAPHRARQESQSLHWCSVQDVWRGTRGKKRTGSHCAPAIGGTLAFRREAVMHQGVAIKVASCRLAQLAFRTTRDSCGSAACLTGGPQEHVAPTVKATIGGALTPIRVARVEGGEGALPCAVSTCNASTRG